MNKINVVNITQSSFLSLGDRTPRDQFIEGLTVQLKQHSVVSFAEKWLPPDSFLCHPHWGQTAAITNNPFSTLSVMSRYALIILLLKKCMSVCLCFLGWNTCGRQMIHPSLKNFPHIYTSQIIPIKSSIIDYLCVIKQYC